MDIFGKQAKMADLFQTDPVDAAYALGMTAGKRVAGTYSEVDVALLLLDKIRANEFFDYQLYFVSELSKALDVNDIDVLQSRALAERTRGERFAVDHEYVRARLARLREYVRLLADLRPIERDRFRADPKLYGLGQWYLQQAVELLFGTGAYGIIQDRVTDLGTFADSIERFIGEPLA